MDLRKEDEKGKSHDNFGNEDRKIDKAVQESLPFITVFVKGERRGRTENGGHRRGNESDDERIGERLRHMAVIKKLGVPLNVKPAHTAFMRESLKEYSARIRIGR